MAKTIEDISAVDRESGLVNVVIETPRNCRYKYKYDPKLNAFAMSKLLPAGLVFPFDFGFIPSTMAEDGDPLDVLLLLDEPVVPGIVVPSRLIGVIEAEQTERDGTKERNDRLIGVAATSELYEKVVDLVDLPATVLRQVERFFISYNEQAGKKFKVLSRYGADRARKLLKKARPQGKRKKG